MIQPDSDFGEHLARARFFLEQAKSQSDPQEASWFVMTSVYSARAVVELMVDYFKTKKLKGEFKDFLAAAEERVPYFKATFILLLTAGILAPMVTLHAQGQPSPAPTASTAAYEPLPTLDASVILEPQYFQGP